MGLKQKVDGIRWKDFFHSLFLGSGWLLARVIVGCSETVYVTYLSRSFLIQFFCLTSLTVSQVIYMQIYYNPSTLFLKKTFPNNSPI